MIKKPLFSTVNTTVFPGSTYVFIIGRDFSIGSVKEAMKNHNGELIITAQKEMSADKAGINGMYQVGCLCRIENEIELQDGTVKFAARALDRIRISEISEEKNVRFASGNLIERPAQKKSIAPQRKEKLLSKLKSLKSVNVEDDFTTLKGFNLEVEDYEFVMNLSHFLRYDQIQHRDLTFEEVNSGKMLLDVLTQEEKQNVNQGMARMQEILESNDLEKSLQKMEKMLGV